MAGFLFGATETISDAEQIDHARNHVSSANQYLAGTGEHLDGLMDNLGLTKMAGSHLAKAGQEIGAPMAQHHMARKHIASLIGRPGWDATSDMQVVSKSNREMGHHMRKRPTAMTSAPLFPKAIVERRSKSRRPLGSGRLLSRACSVCKFPSGSRYLSPSCASRISPCSIRGVVSGKRRSAYQWPMRSPAAANSSGLARPDRAELCMWMGRCRSARCASAWPTS